MCSNVMIDNLDLLTIGRAHVSLLLTLAPRWRHSYLECFGFISGQWEEVETHCPSLFTVYDCDQLTTDSSLQLTLRLKGACTFWATIETYLSYLLKLQCLLKTNKDFNVSPAFP